MADIKFSQFTAKSVYTDVSDVVGYDGADNVRITPDNLITSWNQQQDTIDFCSAGATAISTIEVGDFSNTNTSIDLKLLGPGAGTRVGAYKIRTLDAISLDYENPGPAWNIADGQIRLDIAPPPNSFRRQTILRNEELLLGAATNSTIFAFKINPGSGFNGGSQIYFANKLFAERIGGPGGEFTIGSGKEISWLDGSDTLEIFEDVIFTKNGADRPAPHTPNSVTSISLGTGAAATRGAIDNEGFIDYDIGQNFNFFLEGAANTQWQYFTGTGAFAISYYGVGRFLGSGIHIFSDERIKKDISVSDSTKDLETISKIEISDYTHIDQVKGGQEKKVIAQQVEEHYPLAVKQGTDCIPDIFKPGTIEEGVIDFVFDCEVGDKIKIMRNQASSEVVEVLEIKEDGIKVDSNFEGEVFVYGKEVNDYKTVDYDALSMLNISATQELYKIIKELKEEIEELKK
jgi:hypothetical protein